MIANATANASPDHLTDIAKARQTPAPMRHHLMPSDGPSVDIEVPIGETGERSYQETSFSRAWSRSTTRQANAARTQNIRKMSSSAVREST